MGSAAKHPRLLGASAAIPFVLALAALVGCATTTQPAGKVLSNCLGAVCLRSAPWSEDYLVREFGRGVLEEASIGGELSERSHCYYDSSQNLWVRIAADFHSYGSAGAIESVLVTRQAICPETSRPSKAFSRFRGERGIAVGWTEKHVLSSYGSPVWTQPPSSEEAELGSTVMFYAPEGPDSLLGLRVFIKDSKVFSLELIHSE